MNQDIRKRLGWVKLYTDIKDPRLMKLLDEWQNFYNWERPHGALYGKTNIDKYCKLMYQTPIWEEVEAMYDAIKERIQEAGYNKEMSLRKLKRSV